MYTHLLLPTDGSKLAAKGIREGARLAKALGAKVSGVYVAPPFVAPIRGEATGYYRGPYPRGEYRRLTESLARKALDVVERSARAAGVLGSETHRVLAHSKIPVLVVR